MDKGKDWTRFNIWLIASNFFDAGKKDFCKNFELNVIYRL